MYQTATVNLRLEWPVYLNEDGEEMIKKIKLQ